MRHPDLATQFDELRHIKNYSDLNLEDGYQIVPAAHPSWTSAKRRFLFVVESVDSIDIKEGRLFSSKTDKRGNEFNAMIATFQNTLTQSWHLYQEYLGKNSLTDPEAAPDFSIAVVNFNALKYFHLQDIRRRNVLLQCAKRTQEVVKRLKPTDVVIFGDTAAHYLLTKIPNRDIIPFTRGWVHKTEIAGHPCKAMHTLDLEPLYNSSRDDGEGDDDGGFDDQSGPADLLYYVCRNLCNAYAGKHLHSLEDLKAKPILVDTVEKFDKFYEKLKNHEGPLGFDIETESLAAVHNKFYSHQYAFTTDKAYLIPLDHPKTGFTKKELDYIHSKLKSFWKRRSRKVEIVGINLQFDLKVVRGLYQIRCIYYPIWDVTAGEQLLDENVGLFDRVKFYLIENQVKTTMGNLRNLFCHYGNSAYYQMKFTKEDRHKFGNMDICNRDDTEAHEARVYACLDAQSCLGIREKQIERASFIRINRHTTYETIYHRHVTHQMSNIVHGISLMHGNGSNLDEDYLKHLMGPQSPLISVKKQMSKDLSELPNAKKANSLILKEKGIRSTDLWGKEQWVFEISKPANRHVLFYDVMELKAVSQTDTGKPAIDKVFFKAYAGSVKEAGIVEQWQKASKLLSTYVKGWYEKLNEDLDSIIDRCLRPSFGFFGVVTGRLNSFKPSLQQVPARGAIAKYIKRMFVPRKGCLNMKWDFNAAEVRFWGILANDEKVAGSFISGQKLRQEYIKTPSEELRKELKTKGDVHIQSVHRFFGIWVDKEHELRSAIKAIVFGLVYGKSTKTLVKDVFNKDKRLKELEAKLEALRKELEGA